MSPTSRHCRSAVRRSFFFPRHGQRHADLLAFRIGNRYERSGSQRTLNYRIVGKGSDEIISELLQKGNQCSRPLLPPTRASLERNAWSMTNRPFTRQATIERTHPPPRHIEKIKIKNRQKMGSVLKSQRPRTAKSARQGTRSCRWHPRTWSGPRMPRRENNHPS